jgi:hypothetical protein
MLLNPETIQWPKFYSPDECLLGSMDPGFGIKDHIPVARYLIGLMRPTRTFVPPTTAESPT